MLNKPYIDINLATQVLQLLVGDNVLFTASVSTALNGAGEEKDTGCTPRGWHTVRAIIGKEAPQNTVFIGRRATGEIYTPALAASAPNRDWILTRILWLRGTEIGKNLLGNVDTMQRFIYIHGCPDDCPMGEPLSHGCVRMRNADIEKLAAMIAPNIKVFIHA